MVEITNIPVDNLKPNARNARTHSKKQIRQIADSIAKFGFVNPILADQGLMVIAGHGRLEAAKLLGLSLVPVVQLNELSDAKKRALMLADNKIASNAGWDREKLAAEIADLGTLLEVEMLDISLTGFEVAEIDQLVIDFEQQSADVAEQYDNRLERKIPVSNTGDIWLMGQHRLMCGNARSAEDVNRLMEGNVVNMCFADPPYNVRVASIVGRGRTKHREFAEASGEMSSDQFAEFLKTTLGNAARVSREGAVHYVCMDWRHLDELMAAGRTVYQTHLNTIVWVKTSPGQGSFYRSQHEMILAYRVGSSAHLNNIELGKHGRSRSNVWTYPGVNTFKTGDLDDLQVHPTVKPIALVADAMRDCTRKGDLVLDLFSGSGSTILAAERIGRRAYAIEIDPLFVDVAIRRWQKLTGKDAIRASDQTAFDDCESRHQANAREG